MLVIIALVAGLTPNSSATNLITAVKGAPSGTESLHMSVGLYLRLEGQLWIRCVCNLESYLLLDGGGAGLFYHI